MNWYIHVMKNYATFSGRARRKEYWMFVLFNIIFASIAAAIDYALFEAPGIIYGLYVLAIIVPSIAVAVRRLHDIGKGGGWFFISFVPVIGGIWFLVLMLTDSQPGENEYGPNPKE